MQEEVLKIIDNNENVAIAEIAKVSGVSKTTVSRILSGKTNLVKKEMIEKVSKIIKEHNYKPKVLLPEISGQKNKGNRSYFS